MVNFIESFPPGYRPSDTQAQALEEISEGFKKHKFVICCAPTGSGKSFIAKSIANASKDASKELQDLVKSYKAYEKQNGEYTYADDCKSQPRFGGAVLTSTKALQDQYERFFDDSKTLKGKSNYVCKVDENYSVDVAPCVFIEKLKRDCWSCNKCLYYNARNEAIVGKFSVFNYTMFLCLPEHLTQRQYLICDEAAELEDELVKNFSVDLNTKALHSLLPKFSQLIETENLSIVKTYLNGLTPALYEKIKELEKKVSKEKKAKNLSEVSKLSLARSLHSQISNALENWNQCEYIAEKTKLGVVIAPLRVNKLSRFLFDSAEKVLLMSATIIDPANYAKSLGITDYTYVEMPSSFDAAKAPIIVSSKYRMNRKNWESLMPVFIKTIKEICERHKDDKGIIHTHNMEITNYLSARLTGRFLSRENGVSNQEILEQHMATTNNTVLISPSMTHGIDLKDDLARFQIIVKAPYLPLNSKRIKKLFDLDPQWYANKMLTTVIQASGRGIRSKEDHCVTYILDGNIGAAIVDNAKALPKYFLQRFL